MVWMEDDILQTGMRTWKTQNRSILLRDILLVESIERVLAVLDFLEVMSGDGVEDGEEPAP